MHSAVKSDYLGTWTKATRHPTGVVPPKAATHFYSMHRQPRGWRKHVTTSQEFAMIKVMDFGSIQLTWVAISHRA